MKPIAQIVKPSTLVTRYQNRGIFSAHIRDVEKYLKSADLFTKEEQKDLFEKLSPAPEGQGYFFRQLSIREAVKAKKTNIPYVKNMRYYDPEKMPDFGYTVSSKKSYLGSLFEELGIFDQDAVAYLLFTLNPERDVEIVCPRNMRNSFDPCDLVDFKAMMESDKKKGIGVAEKLAALENTENDCMVNIPCESYEKSKLIIPQSVYKSSPPSLAGYMLGIFNKYNGVMGGDNISNFVLVSQEGDRDVPLQVKSGQEEKVREILQDIAGVKRNLSSKESGAVR